MNYFILESPPAWARLVRNRLYTPIPFYATKHGAKLIPFSYLTKVKPEPRSEQLDAVYTLGEQDLKVTKEKLHALIDEYKGPIGVLGQTKNLVYLQEWRVKNKYSRLHFLGKQDYRHVISGSKFLHVGELVWDHVFYAIIAKTVIVSDLPELEGLSGSAEQLSAFHSRTQSPLQYPLL